jgi:hypothetical protein
MFRGTVTHAPRFSEDVSNNWMHLTWTMMAPIETITVQQKRKKKINKHEMLQCSYLGLYQLFGFFFFLVIELLQKTRREIEKDVSMASHA